MFLYCNRSQKTSQRVKNNNLLQYKQIGKCCLIVKYKCPDMHYYWNVGYLCAPCGIYAFFTNSWIQFRPVFLLWNEVSIFLTNSVFGMFFKIYLRTPTCILDIYLTNTNTDKVSICGCSVNYMSLWGGSLLFLKKCENASADGKV